MSKKLRKRKRKEVKGESGKGKGKGEKMGKRRTDFLVDEIESLS